MALRARQPLCRTSTLALRSSDVPPRESEDLNGREIIPTLSILDDDEFTITMTTPLQPLESIFEPRAGLFTIGDRRYSPETFLGSNFDGIIQYSRLAGREEGRRFSSSNRATIRDGYTCRSRRSCGFYISLSSARSRARKERPAGGGEKKSGTQVRRVSGLRLSARKQTGNRHPGHGAPPSLRSEFPPPPLPPLAHERPT